MCRGILEVLNVIPVINMAVGQYYFICFKSSFVMHVLHGFSGVATGRLVRGSGFHVQDGSEPRQKTSPGRCVSCSCHLQLPCTESSLDAHQFPTAHPSSDLSNTSHHSARLFLHLLHQDIHFPLPVLVAMQHAHPP